MREQIVQMEQISYAFEHTPVSGMVVQVTAGR